MRILIFLVICFQTLFNQNMILHVLGLQINIIYNLLQKKINKIHMKTFIHILHQRLSMKYPQVEFFSMFQEEIPMCIRDWIN